MIDKIRDNLELIIPSVFIVLFLGLMVIAIVASVEEQAAWETWCGEQGGHVTENTDTNIGYDVRGRPVTTTSTTYYCLTTDGRIIDIN